MKAVVLAAGKGERLYPFTKTRPKPLIPLLDKPILERIIEYLLPHTEEIVVISNIQVLEYLKKREIKKVIPILQREGTRGTAAALMTSPAIQDDFIVVYGDLVFENTALDYIMGSDTPSILGVEVEDPRSYGVIETTENGDLKNIIEKPESPPSKMINGGIYKLPKDVWEIIKEVKPSVRGELELTDVVTTLARKRSVKVISYKGLWLDVGKPWDIIEANKKLLDYELREKGGQVIRGVVENNVVIKGSVIIEENALVKSGTYIEGPVFIGEGAQIGPNAYLRAYSIIGKGVKIGASVEVKESVIMENSRIPHLSYIGDSVIGENVNFGAGTLVANLRFDERSVKVTVKGERINSNRKKLGCFVGGYAKTGINVSILPGVIIGARAMIYPGAVVARDVKSDEIYPKDISRLHADPDR